MIDKMIKRFEGNYKKENYFYGEGHFILTPKLIKNIFDRSDIFKLLNIEYSEEANEFKTMISCGSFGYIEDGYNKDNFLTITVMGCAIEEDLVNILTHEIVERFEKYLIHLLRIHRGPSMKHPTINSREYVSKRYDLAKSIYKDDIILTSKCFLSEEDIKICDNTSSIGCIVHLRDNIYVDRYGQIIKNDVMIFSEKLCDYNPSDNVILYNVCNNGNWEIYFDVSISNFIKHISWDEVIGDENEN